MALSQEIRRKASNYADNGQWLKLAMLVLQFGKELIIYLRERKKQREYDKKLLKAMVDHDRERIKELEKETTNESNT